jgi:hypothetical protein
VPRYAEILSRLCELQAIIAGTGDADGIRCSQERARACRCSHEQGAVCRAFFESRLRNPDMSRLPVLDSSAAMLLCFRSSEAHRAGAGVELLQPCREGGSCLAAAAYDSTSRTMAAML